MNTTSPSHMWFCRSCRTKGGMSGTTITDIIFAETEHETASPNCTDMIRAASSDELEKDTDVKNYKDWLEDA